jgi:hypothetical protein
MARLIQKLQDAGPSLIVIDKYFSPESCPNPEDTGNQMLGLAISSSTIPIVLGLHTLDADQLKLRGALSRSEEDNLKVAPLVVSPTLQFANPSGLVSYGLIRLNHDNRKIPLEWRAYLSRSELAAPEHHTAVLPTLSRVAAEQADPNLSSDGKFKYLISKAAHPYTGFLSEEEIPTFSALDLVCGPQFPRDSDWESCELSGYKNQTIRNHIVIIGNSTDDQDINASVIGLVPGVVLQANYIESLLDDRYLKPVSLLGNIIINLSAAFVIGFLFLSTSSQKHGLLSPERVAVASLILSLLLWVLSYLIVLHLGYYLAIWFPGLYVLALWAHTRLHKIEEDKGKKVEEVKVREVRHA